MIFLIALIFISAVLFTPSFGLGNSVSGSGGGNSGYGGGGYGGGGNQYGGGGGDNQYGGGGYGGGGWGGGMGCGWRGFYSPACGGCCYYRQGDPNAFGTADGCPNGYICGGMYGK
uniref:Uncharacterized protein n=1 Tax=Acrobeloides nanus TaxID=290746 RepID=A0A914DBB5_9BILA